MSLLRDRKFFRILWDVCDGVATVEEYAALERRLADDPVARRDYLHYVALHTDLASEGNAVELAAASTSRRTPLHGGSRPRSVLLMASAVACVFYGVFVLLAWNLRAGSMQRAINGKLHASAASRPTSSAPAARLVARNGKVRRLGKTDLIRSGSSILEREVLEVASGTASLRFSSGAEVLLHAGSQFGVETANSGSLRVGKLLARVPPKARGFAIETAQSRVVDLGTEFAVQADRQGATDIHVFEGQVDVTPLAEDGKPKPLRLKAGEARRIRIEPIVEIGRGGRAVWETLTAEKSGFEDVVEELELAQKEGLVLWLRADAIDRDDPSQVRKGPGGAYVSRWRDMAGKLGGAADVAQSAPERQPVLLAKALHGMPAVRFVRERLSCLVNETHVVVPAGSPRTVFFVGRAAEREDRAIGGELLRMPSLAGGNSNVPAFIVQHYFTGPHFTPNKYYVYSDLSGQDWTADDASSIIVRPFVALFRSAGAGSSAEIQLNGRPLKFAAGVVTKEAESPGLIIGALGNDGLDGAQAWDGDLAEVLFYDRALSEESVQSVAKYLASKYRLAFPAEPEKTERGHID